MPVAWRRSLALLASLSALPALPAAGVVASSARRPTRSAASASRSAEVATPLPTVVVVHVVDSASGRPLPNAEVAAPPVRRLTDVDGNARFPWPADGQLRIRVRQLGFRYAQRTLHRGTSPTAREDTVVVALQTAAFALPQVVTQAPARCEAITDSAALALSLSSMELLRFGAEQYGTFRGAYPFSVTLARRTVRNTALSGPRVEETKETAESETYGDDYHPGQVLLRIPKGYYVPVLFVSTLADTAFLRRHCFVAKGVETREGRRVVRLDFAPSRDVREVDWAGTAWIDSAASVLRRVDFQLANLHVRGAPRRFEGYTTFSMPSPFIAVPDSTVAWWWTQTRPSPTDDKFTADMLQFISTRDLAYKGPKPPAPR
jgi:hypothetical protein